jgi:hypothetical protein
MYLAVPLQILSLLPYYAQVSNMRAIMAIGGLGMIFTAGEILGHLLCSSIQRDRHVFISSRALSFLSVGALLINQGIPLHCQLCMSSVIADHTRLGETGGLGFGRLQLWARKRYLYDNDYAVHRPQRSKAR